MNPLKIIDTLEEAFINKITSSNQIDFTQEEIVELVKKAYSDGRQAIFKGEYILNLEDIDSNIVTVSGKEYAIQKLIAENNKYLLIVQVSDTSGESFIDTDYAILMEELKNAAKIAGNVSGIIIIPPTMQLSLVTAKIDTDSYAKSIGLFDEISPASTDKVDMTPLIGF